jgi:hypothetical protein
MLDRILAFEASVRAGEWAEANRKIKRDHAAGSVFEPAIPFDKNHSIKES